MVEYIIENVFSIFDKDDVKIIIYYGNKGGRDIDVFVILTGEIEYSCIYKDFFDITYVGERNVNKMIKNFDPLLTEPLLTGDVLYGELSHIKNNLMISNYSKKTFEYLKGRSKMYFNWAEKHFENGDLIYSCDCLRFSLSFFYFAIHYKKGGKIITFSDLLKKDNNCKNIKKIEKIVKNKKKVTNKLVKKMLIKVFKILT